VELQSQEKRTMARDLGSRAFPACVICRRLRPWSDYYWGRDSVFREHGNTCDCERGEFKVRMSLFRFKVVENWVQRPQAVKWGCSLGSIPFIVVM
jgi:hypothetical protein